MVLTTLCRPTLHAILLTAGLCSASALSASSDANTADADVTSGSAIHNQQTCNPSGIALSGIDVVSYHNPTGPLIGSAEFAVTHNSLSYRFLNAAHATQFSAAPEKYLPKYMGWCATSLAFGALTCPNPLNYKIENGDLLLFETTGFTNGQNLWNADPLDYRRRANRSRDAFLQTPGR